MAGLTFQQLIDKTINYLNGGWTNRPKLGTVTSLTLDGDSNVTALLVTPVDGTNSHRGPAVLEIDNKLVFSSAWDSNAGTATVPAWGNGFEGSAKLTLPLVSDKVTINPLWPRHFVARYLMDAIESLYPRLYGVKVQELTSDVTSERYEVADDCEEIISVKVEGFGPTLPRREIKRHTLEVSNADGNRYLSIQPIGLSGRKIVVRYRTKPVLPTGATDTVWDWGTSLLPSSASDLPALRAAYTLISSSELAKMQTYSAEQSERNRLVQAGAGNSASRRLEEMFDRRLAEEQQSLQSLNPTRTHQRYN